MRILILEDGSWVADELSRMLRRQGCAVEVARSSEQAVRNTAAQSLDLLILDLSLRVIDGARLLRALEEQRDRVPPLLVLTAREQVDERVQALELGADCLAEPFAMPELAARVRALIRRSRSREDARRIVHGPLVVDSDARRAYLGGEPLALVPREWAVLEVLLRQAERVVSKESISQTIAGCGKPVSANTIETYVSRLRAKLEPAGIRIRTVHRVGYMLEAAHELRAAAAAS
jgi:two-component system OmpR family response regulator